MNKEEITYKIPNNQIHISEIKDEDCLIWISPKALNMANTIDELLQENKKYKEVIDKAIEFTNKNWGTWCTHHLEYMTELQDILKGSDNNVKD